MSAATVTTLPVRHAWREVVLFEGGEQVDVYALAVVYALHAHMDRHGIATVGLRRLAALARCSVPTLRRRIGVLERAGLLEVRRTPRVRTVYRAVVPADLCNAEPDGQVVAVQPGGPGEGDGQVVAVQPGGPGEGDGQVVAVQPASTDGPDGLCNPSAAAVQPGRAALCNGSAHVPLPVVEPQRGRARVRGREDAVQRPSGQPVRPPSSPAVGPRPDRAPVSWRVEERPDGTLWAVAA